MADEKNDTTPEPEEAATDTEATETETADTETANTETANTETTETETTDTETADTEAADTETPDTETPDTETADTETTPDTANNIVTVEDSGPCKKKISIEIPEDSIKTALDKQFEDLRREAAVPGFRKGRAPLRLVEKRFGSDTREQVKLQLLSDATDAALKDQKIDTLGDPDFDHEKIDLPDTGPMKFDFEVEVRPQFDLPELENIPIEKQKIDITDKNVDKELEELCKRAGLWQPKEDGAVEEDDQVVADVHMKIEDVEEEEKRDNIEIQASKTSFVSGVPVENLDEVLAGAKHGDERKTTVEVPNTFYNEQYRGKKIDLTITVKEVKSLVPAELNEEFLQRFGVEDEDELRERILDTRHKQAEQQVKTAMGDQVYKYLLEKISFDLPESIVADQSMRILQRQYSSMLMQGLPKEQVEERMKTLQGSSEGQAQEQLKLFFIMDKVAETLDIKVTEEEINGQIAQVAVSRGRRPEKMREEMLKDGSLTQFSMQVREQKCIEHILEKARIKEVKAAKPKTEPAKKTTKKAAKKTTKKTPKKTKTTSKKDDKNQK